MPTMNVSLTPELEEVVKNKVKTGLYGNSSEVVREALRLMVERDAGGEVATWGAKIRRGVEQANHGEFVNATIPEIIAEAKAARR